MTFFSFALANGMLPTNCTFVKTELAIKEAKELISESIMNNTFCSCVNKSHVSTLEVLKKFGISIPIPDVPPNVLLNSGDTLIVMGHNLPRLVDRHEYGTQEINDAVFSFSLYRCIINT